MPAIKPGGKYLRELVKQFPDAPALTLAKKAFREHPEYWKTVEACRRTLQYILGINGKRCRQAGDPSLYRAPRKAGWKDVIPEPLQQLPNWGAIQIDGPLKGPILSDIHIPFHDAVALERTLEWCYDRHPDMIFINGDGFDHFAISRWEKDPRLRDFPAEIRAGRQFLKGLRAAFPKARIIFKKGNHEERWEAYLRLKAPELLGVPEFEWGEIYGLEEWDIELIGEKRPVRLGKLNVIHGHEYKFNISNPVLPARGYYERARDHILAGHVHQTSQYTKNDIRGSVVSAWTNGCLCELHPEYAPLNHWNHGFAWVDVEKNGAFRLQNLRIVNGEVY